MNRGEVDGIPVFWEAGPPPLTAALVFGVGTRDETFRTSEVTHLVEHLVMSTLDTSTLDRNAATRLGVTVFHATGDAPSVMAFLQDVCAGIRHLPLHRRAHEAGVIDIEAAGVCHPALASYLGHRYGAQSYGLADSPPDHASTLTDEHVRDHLERFFHRDNVVLVMTGEPPSDLRLDLPSGPAPDQAEPAPIGSFPGMARTDAGEVCLVGEVAEPGVVEEILPILLVERARDDLRATRGIAYEVDLHVERLDAARTVFVVTSDAARDAHGEVARFLWHELDRLSRVGPTEDELGRAVDVWRAGIADPRGLPERLLDQAEAWLLGRPLRETDLERVTGPDVALVREAARQARETGMVFVPDAEDLEGLELPDLDDTDPPAVPVCGDTVFRRRVSCIAPLDLKVRIGEDGLSFTARGTTLSATWPDVVGVGVDDTRRFVMTRSGHGFVVEGRDLRRGSRLLGLIDTHAAGQTYPADAETYFGPL